MPNHDWLTARPIAHRGLHDSAAGVIENTASAVSAAVAANYAIEVDLQITADGEAVVYHDDALGRLTEGTGRLDGLSVADLKKVPFKRSADRIITLGELLDLVAGRVTVVLELKTHYDNDPRLPERVAAVLQTYSGPVAAMSFDPDQIAKLRDLAPGLCRGIVAERQYKDEEWDGLSTWQKFSCAHLLHFRRSRLQFIAYRIHDLPAPAPFFARHLFGLPLLTWTVRTHQDCTRAQRWADQMIFEGFRPI
ncbi:MAG TPA: glycerophosphodiester phosphodiesterase family protein [Xanthobacteraceae bacterium]|jgi:glycerophosphoryl diester phosphodiesterase|nr:glycerophosphodiester phosphodiesterase family protein [Xanthobacteraceae bacterium]